MISKAFVVGEYQRKAEALARCGVELTVIIPDGWNERNGALPLERAYTEGYRLLVVPMRFNGNYHLHFYPTLAARIRELRPQIIHIDEEPYNLATWQTLRLARQHKVRTVLSTWQNLYRRYPPPFAWGERYALRNTDHLIAGTQSAADVWRTKRYAGPLTIIPQFGVDTDRFKPDETRIPKATLQIGYIGRLVPEKGVDLLLNALSGLQDQRWHLQIVGQGPERAALERLAAALGITGRVTFRGQLPSMDLPAVFQQLDLLVIPSRTRPNWKEQFGRVIIEANGCGVPVLGSDSGAIPDSIGAGGRIFREDDLHNLREQLSALLDDEPARRALGAAGRAQVLAYYTQEQIATATVAVYAAVLDSRSS